MAKKASKGTRKSKGARRTSRSRSETQIRIDGLVKLQQESVRQALDFLATSATDFSNGTFRLSNFSSNYAKMVETCIDDYAEVLRTMFGTRA